MSDRIRKYRLGELNCSFARWLNSAWADYLHFLLQEANEVEKGNVFFFDVEFHHGTSNDPRALLVVWRETRPPSGDTGYQVVFDGDTDGKKRLLEAMYRARYIVGYNSRGLDLPALEHWGLDEKRVLLKLIDLYEFVFSVLSRKGEGSLNNISRINGGSGKYHRKDSSILEYQNQCQRDVQILEEVFWKVLSGEFTTPRFGVLRVLKIWHDVRRLDIVKESSPTIDNSGILVQGGAST